MRKILVALLLVIVTISILWIFAGRQISEFVDRFKTVEVSSQRIETLTYERAGSGGVLSADNVELTLNLTELGDSKVNVGTTKDGQVALSFRGRVFPFGAVSAEADQLVAHVPADNVAKLSKEASLVPWPSFFERNFMPGSFASPKWKRHVYRRLTWEKSTGQRLEMLWRYEEHFYSPEGWDRDLRTGPASIGLIRVEISDASR